MVFEAPQSKHKDPSSQEFRSYRPAKVREDMGYVVMPDIGFHRDQEMSNSLRVSQNLAKPVTAKMSGGENPIGNERITVAAQHQRLINVGAYLSTRNPTFILRNIAR